MNNTEEINKELRVKLAEHLREMDKLQSAFNTILELYNHHDICAKTIEADIEANKIFIQQDKKETEKILNKINK